MVQVTMCLCCAWICHEHIFREIFRLKDCCISDQIFIFLLTWVNEWFEFYL